MAFDQKNEGGDCYANCVPTGSSREISLDWTLAREQRPSSTRIYETNWPAEPLPVDADGPSGSSELETIFHEALHTMDQHMVQDLNAAFARNHSPAYDLDHVMIFFTAGFVTKRELRGSDSNYEPFAYREGMYERVKYWNQDEAALRKYWRPFLEGKTTRTEALDRVTHAVCCEPWPQLP